jgi:hypothetical protein
MGSIAKPLTLSLSPEGRGDPVDTHNTSPGTVFTSPLRGEVGAQRRVRGANHQLALDFQS